MYTYSIYTCTYVYTICIHTYLEHTELPRARLT